MRRNRVIGKMQLGTVWIVLKHFVIIIIVLRDCYRVLMLPSMPLFEPSPGVRTATVNQHLH